MSCHFCSSVKSFAVALDNKIGLTIALGDGYALATTAIRYAGHKIAVAPYTSIKGIAFLEGVVFGYTLAVTASVAGEIFKRLGVQNPLTRQVLGHALGGAAAYGVSVMVAGAIGIAPISIPAAIALTVANFALYWIFRHFAYGEQPNNKANVMDKLLV